MGLRRTTARSTRPGRRRRTPTQQAGAFKARLTVSDDTGRSGFENVRIVAGNTRPQVSSTLPVEDGIFDFGDEVEYAFSATDAEEGAVDCADMEVTSAIIHAGHTHQDPTFGAAPAR